MNVGELEAIMAEYGFEPSGIGNAYRRKDVEDLAVTLENRRQWRRATGLRLDVAIWYAIQGFTEHAAYQVARAGRDALDIDEGLSARLREVAANEFAIVYKDDPNYRIRRELAFCCLYSAELYAKAGNILKAEELFDRFLELDLVLNNRSVDHALNHLHKVSLQKVADYRLLQAESCAPANQ